MLRTKPEIKETGDENGEGRNESGSARPGREKTKALTEKIVEGKTAAVLMEPA